MPLPLRASTMSSSTSPARRVPGAVRSSRLSVHRRAAITRSDRAITWRSSATTTSNFSATNRKMPNVPPAIGARSKDSPVWSSRLVIPTPCTRSSRAGEFASKATNQKHFPPDHATRQQHARCPLSHRPPRSKCHQWANFLLPPKARSGPRLAQGMAGSCQRSTRDQASDHRAESPAASIALLQKTFGAATTHAIDGGWRLHADQGIVDYLTPEAVRARFGDATAPREKGKDRKVALVFELPR